jgi:predicted solute-binding protein
MFGGEVWYAGFSLSFVFGIVAVSFSWNTGKLHGRHF